MGFAPEHAGPHDPVSTTPSRQSGSIRRTTSIDTIRPLGLYGPTADVDARARDLVTDRDGAAVEREAAHLSLTLDHPAQVVARIEATPAADGLEALVGCRVGGGFRNAAMAAAPGFADVDSLRHLLLDDLPGATLVSGFAVQYDDASTGTERMSEGARSHRQVIMAQSDICAGWAGDAFMLTTFRDTGILMTPYGPAAPVLESPDDPEGWHPMGDLAPTAMRRRRRIDLGPTDADGTSAFDTHFRDSHVDDDGHETVVHEYVVRGRVDDTRQTIVAVASEARVLPWSECPGALGSASRVVGVLLGDLRRTIRTEFSGLSTCTHLNDTLRSLADLAVLLGRRPTM